MQLFVEHSTIYRYNGAVYLDPHTFRLRPRMTSMQRLLLYDLQVSPIPSGTTEYLDQDGNLALRAWFSAATSELNVRSRFRVELLRKNAFDFILDGNPGRLPLWYDVPWDTALAPYRQLDGMDGCVQEYARASAARARWELMPFLNALNREMFHTFRHVARPDGPAWPPERTLQMGEGSCRDLAVLFCDACRAMGIAARFVSGYECATAGRPDASMHAWAEVYLPEAGWRGFDPSRGLAVTDGHVAVAAGLEAALAAPIAGLYNGACGSRMETYLRMDVETGCCV